MIRNEWYRVGPGQSFTSRPGTMQGNYYNYYYQITGDTEDESIDAREREGCMFRPMDYAVDGSEMRMQPLRDKA